VPVAGQHQGDGKAVPHLQHGHREERGLQQDGLRQLRRFLVLEVSAAGTLLLCCRPCT